MYNAIKISKNRTHDSIMMYLMQLNTLVSLVYFVAFFVAGIASADKLSIYESNH